MGITLLLKKTVTIPDSRNRQGGKILKIRRVLTIETTIPTLLKPNLMELGKTTNL